MKHPFRHAQRLGLDLDRHIVLDAGAGTGKTTVMAERYVQHLLTGVQRATLLTPPGTRPGRPGAGASLESPRDRLAPDAWPGLLPTEVVAITFTRKAASGLRAQIKRRITAIRGQAIEGDDEGIVDVRWRGRAEGVVDLLSSLLDDAPVTTIDAFLNRLVTPYIDELMPRRVDGHVPEEGMETLHDTAIACVWRLRQPSDATDFQIPNGTAVIQARDRLAASLGGQSAAHRVFSAMLRNGAFVDEAQRAIRASTGGQPVDDAALRAMVGSLAEGPELIDFLNELRTALLAWHGHVLTRAEHHVTPSETKLGHTQTRFRELRRWCNEPIPQDAWEQLRWLYGALRITTTGTSLTKGVFSSFFPRNALPSDGGWPAGCGAPKRSKNADTAKLTYIDGLEERKAAVTALFDHPQHRWWATLAVVALELEPGLPFTFIPGDADLWPSTLAHPLPVTPPEGALSTGAAFAADLMEDLFLVHEANGRALNVVKAERGLIDFEDVQRMAADLLLARCPESVRNGDWPADVVHALDHPEVPSDGTSDGPWTDAHIERAIVLAGDDALLVEDLQRRWARLKRLRREFRAFIIDEFQDTNPAHLRLLARLWGPRQRLPGEPAGPKSAWDPTVCVVGDMKQSIYRFRQADVRVMRSTTDAIRRMNRLEADEPRLDAYRIEGAGRDPRPEGDGGDIGGYHQATEHTTGGSGRPWGEVHYGVLRPGVPASAEVTEKRSEGHIEMDENFRTAPVLMSTLNGVFETVLGPSSRGMDGDWYADPQPLEPAGTVDGTPRMEWLVPVRRETEDVSDDLLVPLSPFDDPRSKAVHLENELIAARISALVTGTPIQVSDEVEAPCDGPVDPSDVLVLVHARSRSADLVDRLRSRGVPVMVDRQGNLLEQPVVLPLVAAVEALARPDSTHALAVLARSAAFGLNDATLPDAFQRLTASGNVWDALTVAPGHHGEVARRCQALAASGGIHAVVDALLDESDLLVAHCTDAERQHAERFALMLRGMSQAEGGDPVVLHERLSALSNLQRDGPPAIVEPSGGAVEIMTIHNAKGLERDVVVVAGLFSAGRQDPSQESRDNVRVLPDLVVARPRPWPSLPAPQDGLWRMAKALGDAQAKAERARQFYVALTRVERHLIVAGAPEKATVDANGCLTLPISEAATRTFGDHWMEALMELGRSVDGDDSPWCPVADEDGSSLCMSPTELLADAGLGPDAIPSLLVIHDPTAALDAAATTPLGRLETTLTALEEGVNVQAAEPIEVDHRLRVTPHGLDAAKACPRRHWLERVRGWRPEAFGQVTTVDEDGLEPKPRTSDVGTGDATWPVPTVFGTMVHRVLELGLENPVNAAADPALPASWTGRQPDRLLDQDVLQRVFEEHGMAIEAHPRIAERMIHLLGLIQRGRLGRLASGEEQHGRVLDGLRTEHPFFATLQVPGDPAPITSWTREGRSAVATVPRPIAEVEGRMDLVLAVQHAEHGACLQVVDLKTTGCLGPFNPDDVASGHPLQDLSGIGEDGRTQAERDELSHYALQLTLYSMALEAQESARPEGQRRRVLPPALLVAASGRLVEMTVDEYTVHRTEAERLMRWKVQVSVDPESVPEPERLPADAAEPCKKCPFHRGGIRLCGPQGVDLGPQ